MVSSAAVWVGSAALVGAIEEDEDEDVEDEVEEVLELEEELLELELETEELELLEAESVALNEAEDDVTCVPD